MDNILVYNSNKKEYIKYIQKVLSRLKRVNLQIKKEKLKFYIKKVEFLEYNLKPKKVSIVREKVNKVNSQLKLRDIKDIQKFLEFIEFYQIIVLKFTNLVVPLIDLLKKDILFN